MHVRIIESVKDEGPDTIAVHGESLHISFRRTIRVPDDVSVRETAESLLPPDIGPFPLLSVKQFGDRFPKSMKKRGGIFFPMHRAISRSCGVLLHSTDFSLRRRSYVDTFQVRKTVCYQDLCRQC